MVRGIINYKTFICVPCFEIYSFRLLTKQIYDINFDNCYIKQIFMFIIGLMSVDQYINLTIDVYYELNANRNYLEVFIMVGIRLNY